VANDRKAVALRRLQARFREIQALTYEKSERPEFKAWQLDIETALTIIFGAESHFVKEFKSVSWFPSVYYPNMDPGTYQRSFYAGRANAEGIITAAISAAQHYEVGRPLEPETQRAVTEAKSPTTVVEMAATEFSGWPRTPRRVVFVLFLVLSALYLLWLSLPDKSRETIASRFQTQPAPLAATPPTWVDERYPITILNDQVVLKIAATVADVSVDLVLSCEPPSHVHHMLIGQQYRFMYAAHQYVLTVLQVSDSQAKVTVAPLS
jgi:hypothetical protein